MFKNYRTFSKQIDLSAVSLATKWNHCYLLIPPWKDSRGLLLQMHYLSIFTNSKIAGLALWQFADIPIDRAVSSDEHRPRGLNNKGRSRRWDQDVMGWRVALWRARVSMGFPVSHPCIINFPFKKCPSGQSGSEGQQSTSDAHTTELKSKRLMK